MSSECEPQGHAGQPWRRDAALLRQLFPFGFSVDASGRLLAAGTRWASYAPQVAVGSNFDALFVVQRPVGVTGIAQLRSSLDEAVLLKLAGRAGFELRGQFVDAGDGVLHFAGGPWVANLGALSGLDLALSDFPPHDTRGDMLVLLQMQETSLADMRALANNLRERMAAQSQLEGQLRQIQKMELVGRFAGGMAHNFNNILMAIQGYAELSLTRLDSSDPVRGWIEQICTATEHAASLTHGLLTMSRQNRVKLEPLDLARELREVEKLVAPLLGKRVVLALRIDPALPWVHADSSSLKQILMNLVLNARDAMPNGGRIEISAQSRPAEASKGGGERDRVELAVRDEGVGMDERTKASLFEPFFTTKEIGKGVGLGLSTVYGLVQQIDGTISVESELGRGTTFRIAIPRAAAPVQTAPAGSFASSTNPGEGTGAHILLVDDEPQVRNLLEQILRRDGFRVTAAANAEEALALFAQGAQFALLLSDVMMPGLSGPELAARVDERYGALPTLFISGHTDNARLRSGALPPHQRFLQKPFAPSDLGKALRELLAPAPS